MLLEKTIGLNKASRLGNTVLSNKASIVSGMEGVELIAGVKVTVGESVIVGDKVIVGVKVMVGVSLSGAGRRRGSRPL